VRLVAGIHNLLQYSPATLQRSETSLDCLCAAAHCRSQFVFGCWSSRQQAFQSPQLVHNGVDYYRPGSRFCTSFHRLISLGMMPLNRRPAVVSVSC
jgi:hypothetical protein